MATSSAQATMDISIPPQEQDCDMDEGRSSNKRRLQQQVSDGFVFPKKTSKVTNLTPTSKNPVPTSNPYQILPSETDTTPKQPPSEPKPVPTHAFTDDYKKVIRDLTDTIKNPIHYKYLTDHLLIKPIPLSTIKRSYTSRRPDKFTFSHTPQKLPVPSNTSSSIFPLISPMMKLRQTSPPKGQLSTKYPTSEPATVRNLRASSYPPQPNQYPPCKK